MRSLDAAGVPVIAPVDVFIAKPVGRVGEIPRVMGEVPPLAVTGVKLVASIAGLLLAAIAIQMIADAVKAFTAA